MNYVVENGSGLSNATAYVDYNSFLTYYSNVGVDLSAYSSSIVKGWLNEATRYVDTHYKFKSTPINEDQALEFPRNEWGEEVPNDIVYGTCEIAYARQGNVSDNVKAVGISSEGYGPVSVSYSSGNSANSKKVYSAADFYFSDYTVSKQKRIMPV